LASHIGLGDKRLGAYRNAHDRQSAYDCEQREREKVLLEGQFQRRKTTTVYHHGSMKNVIENRCVERRLSLLDTTVSGQMRKADTHGRQVQRPWG